MYQKSKGEYQAPVGRSPAAGPPFPAEKVIPSSHGNDN